MSCNVTIADFSREDGKLDIVSKYNELMQASLSEDSTYIRMKDTLKALSSELNMTQEQTAAAVTQFASQFAVGVTNQAMSIALSWSKEERDGEYALAKIKADTEVSLANFEVSKANVCKIEKDTALSCANIGSVISSSIRENGKVLTYKADGCTPDTIENTGLKYAQTLQVEADTYSRYADSYRKSGIVQIGIDADQEAKGISGTTDTLTGGYTNQQVLNAERMRIAYEDSKVNHAVNASASMIGQMLTAEISPNDEDVARWRLGVDRLLSQYDGSVGAGKSTKWITYTPAV